MTGQQPTVGYWVEGRMEYPGGTFSHWALCGNGAMLNLTNVLNVIKRYRKGGSAFNQYRIRGAAPALSK